MLALPLASLPRLNAFLNASSAALLILGYICIRRGRILLHKTCMLAAVVCSIGFLWSYIYFHAHAGLVRFTGQGGIRPVYFAILITHTVLAAVIPFFVIVTLYFAFRSRFSTHKKIARWTLPLWLYVSVTGVVIYWLLFVLYAPEWIPAGAAFVR